MIEPDRTEWQVRCAFNAFCKRVLKNEAINIFNERKQRQAKEMTFSDLTPQEENQLYTLDKQYEGEEGQSFQVAGKKITPKLLAEAMRTLPKEKRITVLLYYFFQLSDVEIGQLLDIPRSTVQYRRTSSFERLKRFLEEHADEWDD
ncbi:MULTISPECIES: RNA polymerase sigma factor [Bacillales]|uniref:Sigma factor-like helix-turn-helix DNA-binding protein n=2 Tax=Bacillales TaxID=1385 RepID=A0AAX3W3L6_MAMLE|nr:MULTISPECIES: sigma factor-like helix-turn-helix DNA-binding protein [Bacillales]MBO0994945.1 RNA polymerase subunit sigma [Bacillus sp. SD088]PAD58546.1 RNA polymerase subunit sigma [Bacillus sonorensis]WHI59982.1 sigma factor-like helix-turn-helix DNA-binding protein [Mammaliicoccus lentus]GGP08740.1 RNA polymerase sigma factor [Oceanobacillus neutriphilus]